ncbi:MAG: metallophosphoesterase [Deltaproteobacteria bacterium]|nr:metallophosphoesterase [Deltaproteobacteria bacterium]
MSDIHVGPTIRKERTAEIAQAVNALSPDLIAVTGDLVDGVVTGIGEHVAPLGTMKAPLGVFFVTGNHEYYSGVDEWLEFVRTLGWRTLTNEHVTLTKGRRDPRGRGAPPTAPRPGSSPSTSKI